MTIEAGPTGALRIAPSILAADFGALADAVRAIDAETDWLHVDVMDGHFVPNVSIGPPVVQSLRRYSSRFFDCHLMMSEPGRYLEAFKDAGANGCTVHVEVGGTASLIRDARSHFAWVSQRIPTRRLRKWRLTSATLTYCFS